LSVRFSSFLRVLSLFCVLLLATSDAAAQAAPEYRGFWVDTFNTRLNTPDDVATVVARAQQARANLLLVQVRRRGDAWYLNALEPPPDGVAIAQNFDPLQEIVAQGHAAGLQVHAYVVVADVWHQTTLPTSPSHVFTQHGLTASGAPQSGRANWLTRTLSPDGQGTSYSGYRFGADFWIDPGHPDAATYTVNVLMRLVSSYDIDGLHLDRLHYPDFGPTSSQPPTTQLAQGAASVGYNETSLERYRRRYGLSAGSMPDAGDASWIDWRREQVTMLMRRLYLSATALKPRLVVSASAYAGGDPPGSDESWPSAEPVSRVFQDWRAWMNEGIVDLIVPMAYRTEHTTAGAESFQRWASWTRAHTYGRHAAMGVGAYLNSVEGSLRQARRALASGGDSPVAVTLPPPRGVVFFSMGAHNAPVTQNPLAITGRDTPYRAFEDLAAGLTTGRTVAGQFLEPASSQPLFAAPAATPSLPWKSSPTTGHLMGIVTTGSSGTTVDGAEITIEDAGPVASAVAKVRTDGSGFYGRVGLAPGEYRIVVSPSGETSRRSACTVTVRAGEVATLDLRLDSASPVTAACP
jgi:uncharacterized lipoprotein YddW (UPF0748 family)